MKSSVECLPMLPLVSPAGITCTAHGWRNSELRWSCGRLSCDDIPYTRIGYNVLRWPSSPMDGVCVMEAARDTRRVMRSAYEKARRAKNPEASRRIDRHSKRKRRAEERQREMQSRKLVVSGNRANKARERAKRAGRAF